MSIPTSNPQTFGWIRTALQESVDKAIESINHARTESDLSALASVSDNLHQIQGSLRMVELDAASMLADDLERLSDDVEKFEGIQIQGEALARLKKGIDALQGYLIAIETNKPNSPLSLVDDINAIRDLTSRSKITSYDLFNPPLFLKSAIAGNGTGVPADIRHKLVFNLRKRYRKALLTWLGGVIKSDNNKTASNQSKNGQVEKNSAANDKIRQLQVMTEMVSHLHELSSLDVLQQLWWVAGGFIEAIADGSIAADSGVKSQFARLDLEMSRMKDESLAAIASSPPDELLRRMLFYIGGISDSRSARISDIKGKIGLDAWFALEAPAQEPDEFARLKEAMASLGEDISIDQLDRIESRVDRHFSGQLEQDEFNFMCASIESMVASSREREMGEFVQLLEKIDQAIKQVDNDPKQLQETSADIKIASALLLVRDSICGRAELDDLWKESVNSRIVMLELLIRKHEDSETTVSDVAQQADFEFDKARQLIIERARSNLERIERRFSDFEADSQNRDGLREVLENLDELVSWFKILDYEPAANLVQDTRLAITRIADGQILLSDTDHEKVAFVVASLGVAIDQLQTLDEYSTELIENARPMLGEIGFDCNGLDKAGFDGIGRDGQNVGEGLQTEEIEQPQEIVQSSPAASEQRDSHSEANSHEGDEVESSPLESLLGQLDEVRLILRKQPDSELDLINLATLFSRIAERAGAEDRRKSVALAMLGSSVAESINRGEIRFHSEIENFIGLISLQLRKISTQPDEQVDIDIGAWHSQFESLSESAAARANSKTGANINANEQTEAKLAEPKLTEQPDSAEEAGRLDDPGLREIFLAELTEHLDVIERGLPALIDPVTSASTLVEAVAESAAGTAEDTQRELLRTTHTLSGNCRNLGLDEMAVCAEGIGAIFDQTPLNQTGQASLGESSQAQLSKFIEISRTAAVEISDQGQLSESTRSAFIQLQERFSQSVDSLVDDGDQDWEFTEEIQEIFLTESEAILGRINADLTDWRNEGPSEELLAAIRREFHTLKGSAAATGFDNISQLSHSVESLLAQGRDVPGSEDVGLLNLLEETHDGLAADLGFIPASSKDLVRSLNSMVVSLLSGEKGGSDTGIGDSDSNDADSHSSDRVNEEQVGDSNDFEEKVISSIRENTAAEVEPVFNADSSSTGSARPGRPDIASSGTGWMPTASMQSFNAKEIEEGPVGGYLRIGNQKLADLINTSGELGIVRTQIKSTLESTRQELDVLRSNMKQMREGLRELELEADAQIRSMPEQAELTPGEVEFDPLQLDRYSRLQAKSREVAEKLDSLARVERTLAERTSELGGALTQEVYLGSQLQEGLLSARMVAINDYLPRLRHIVRETARRSNKEVELTLFGGDIEVDRQVIDSMMAPLEHMIRNSVGHGLESAQERKQSGKDAEGHLQINAVQQGTELIIEYSDDGKGLDVEKLSISAVEMGMVDSIDEVRERHLLQIITQPGYTTSESVSLESGRGVGMDVVYQAVRELGGSMALNSEVGKGVRFQFRLPVTLAITQALMIVVGSYRFAILTRTIDRLMRAGQDEIVQIDDQEFVVFDDQQIPIINLASQIGEASVAQSEASRSLLLIRLADRVTAFEVDEFQEAINIVSKTPGTQLASIQGVAGVTVMADSSIVVILDPGAFIDRAVLQSEALTRFLTSDSGIALEFDGAGSNLQQDLNRVLVVDDSLVVRKVMQKDLEGLGLAVITAVDGVNALEVLGRDKVDLALVDIEMPRMNGYELLVQLREDPAYQDLPVIIVTSRSGDQHREKALSLGADEYITKPYDVSVLREMMYQVTGKKGNVH